MRDELSIDDRMAQSPLPTYQEEMKQIRSFLVQDGTLALLFIDAARLNKIEQNFGKEVYRKVLASLTEIIVGLKGRDMRKDDFLTLYGVECEQFLVFLTRKRDNRPFHSSGIENLADRVAHAVNLGLAQAIHPYCKTRPEVSVGHAIMIHNPLIQEERQIYKLIEDAKVMSQYQHLRHAMRNKEKVQELIIKEEITTVYQPIVNLTDFSLLGYEALTRGPRDTEYESPYYLFSTAAEANLTFELDRLCRRKAFFNAGVFQEGQRLFINCLPATLHDPGFKGHALSELLQKVNLPPSRIVMEISEREAIENYPLFRSAVNYYTDLGFAIAVDDAGAGHSSLETVIELKPQFLKLDLSLVRGIDGNPVKQELVKAMLTLARSMNSIVIAEGIETHEELDMLRNLDVPYGQGYLIARPAPGLVVPVKL